MAEGYQPVKAEDLAPGDFILIPPASGRHRSHGAIDGSSHMRVLNVAVHLQGNGWVDVYFENCGVTLSIGYLVKVAHRR